MSQSAGESAGAGDIVVATICTPSGLLDHAEVISAKEPNPRKRSLGTGIEVPAVVPCTTRGLSALNASTIKAMLHSKSLPSDGNKRTNVAALATYVRNARHASAHNNNPFLNSSKATCDATLSYDYMLCIDTVRASAHLDLGQAEMP